MKKITLILLIFGFTIQLKAQKPLTLIQASEITDVQFFPVISYMNLIESKNKPSYNDSLSTSSALVIKQTLLKIKEIPVTDTVIVVDKVKYEKEVEFLFSTIIKKKQVNEISLTPIIDSLLSASGKRFGIIIFSSGFSRGKGNYGKEIAKSVGVGLLTLGMYTPVPYKASSNLYVMIVDAQNHNVGFYNRSNFLDREPLDQKVVFKQLQSMFKGFYAINNN